MSPQPTPVLFVEGQVDHDIIVNLLRAARYPLDRIDIVIAHGKVIAGVQAHIAAESGRKCAILLDADEQHIPDAQTKEDPVLASLNIHVFHAVPSIEAWAFADDRLLSQHIILRNPDAAHLALLIRSLPLPDEIREPKRLLTTLLKGADLGFLASADVGYACARSASLHTFLQGIAQFIGIPSPLDQTGPARNLSRDLLANLIREVSPADTVLWRTLDGDVYTASQLRQHIEDGSEIGHQYAADLLRISRDFLRRAANRSASSKAKESQP